MPPREPAPAPAEGAAPPDAPGKPTPRPPRGAKAATDKPPKNLALIKQIVEAFQDYTEEEVEKIADAYRARAKPAKGRPRGRSCRKPPAG